MEIAQGRFERVLMLPQEVDPERITAVHKDGFLSIRIPRDPLGG
jgi:HSP20 family molecular chaperone IbpA